jgi:hypothetical protein
MKITREKFIDVWMQAYKGDHNMQWIVDQLSDDQQIVTKQMVSIKAKRLRADGIPLPELKRYRKQEIDGLKNMIYKELSE